MLVLEEILLDSPLCTVQNTYTGPITLSSFSPKLLVWDLLDSVSTGQHIHSLQATETGKSQNQPAIFTDSPANKTFGPE